MNNSIDPYGSGQGLLNDFSSELYSETMRICRPVISGENIVKKTHSGVAIRSIDKIMHLSYEEQDAILDFLTELVIEEENEDWDKFLERTIDKIRSKRKFKAHFDALDNYFKKLNNTQKFQVIGLSINKLNSGIEGIRREINDRLWNKNANVKELLIIDQILYFFQNIINVIPLRKKLKKSENKELNSAFGFSCYLILRLEAYRRDKITLDDLNDDLSLSHFKPIDKYVKPSEYEVALEIFGG